MTAKKPATKSVLHVQNYLKIIYFLVSLAVVVVSELAGSVTTQNSLDIWRFPPRKSRRVDGKREMKSTSAGTFTEAQV